MNAEQSDQTIIEFYENQGWDVHFDTERDVITVFKWDEDVNEDHSDGLVVLETIDLNNEEQISSILNQIKEYNG
tara:strand:- start:90 stop:311 length:222 start_codon:yes stop_codon:yes gene_type:complete